MSSCQKISACIDSISVGIVLIVNLTEERLVM